MNDRKALVIAVIGLICSAATIGLGIIMLLRMYV